MTPSRNNTSRERNQPSHRVSWSNKFFNYKIFLIPVRKARPVTDLYLQSFLLASQPVRARLLHAHFYSPTAQWMGVKIQHVINQFGLAIGTQQEIVLVLVSYWSVTGPYFPSLQARNITSYIMSFPCKEGRRRGRGKKRLKCFTFISLFLVSYGMHRQYNHNKMVRWGIYFHKTLICLRFEKKLKRN